MFANVDWTKTNAYAMGLNALYINLAGREKNGIVHSGAERDAVVAESEAAPGGGCGIRKRGLE